MHIGEPKHPTPEFIKKTLMENLGGLAAYPTTLGGEGLRIAIAEWLKRRYGLKAIDPQTEIIPVNGSRDALFAFGQAVIDRTRADALVVTPDPFYQIYEGAGRQPGSQPRAHRAGAAPRRMYRCLPAHSRFCRIDLATG